MGRSFLKAGEEHLPERFLESWTYSAARDLVEQCRKWEILIMGDGKVMTAEKRMFEGSMGELIELARRQVRFFSHVGHTRLCTNIISSPA